jgi:hypothetical protein
VTTYVTIRADGDKYIVELIEDVYGRTRTRRRTVCSSLAIAKGIAKSWSIQNGSCPIKELSTK